MPRKPANTPKGPVEPKPPIPPSEAIQDAIKAFHKERPFGGNVVSVVSSTRLPNTRPISISLRVTFDTMETKNYLYSGLTTKLPSGEEVVSFVDVQPIEDNDSYLSVAEQKRIAYEEAVDEANYQAFKKKADG